MSQAASVAGTGLSAVGDLQQGYANSNIAGYNADTATNNAATVTAQGAEEARRSNVASSRLIGSEAAGYGASGVQAGGMGAQVMRNSATQGALNAATLENNAAIKATAYQNEASLDRYRGSNDVVAGYMGASGALLKGLSGGAGGGGSGGSGSADDADELEGGID